MKRFLSGWVCALGSVSIALVAIATPQAALAATVTLDGQPVTSVISHAGNLLIPFRAPMERIGATVDYNKPTATATLPHGQQLVTVSTGDTNATIRGNPRVLSIAPSLINGETYVPVDVLSSICGAHVAYSADRQSATVTGCTLAGLNAAALHAPAVNAPAIPPVAAPAAPNLWPWIIGLLILLALLGLIAWLLSRRKTIVTTNVYSQTGRVAGETTPGAPRTTPARGTLDDPKTRP
jgi:hypothetical protein